MPKVLRGLVSGCSILWYTVPGVRASQGRMDHVPQLWAPVKGLLRLRSVTVPLRLMQTTD